MRRLTHLTFLRLILLSVETSVRDRSTNKPTHRHINKIKDTAALHKKLSGAHVVKETYNAPPHPPSPSTKKMSFWHIYVSHVNLIRECYVMDQAGVYWKKRFLIIDCAQITCNDSFSLFNSAFSAHRDVLHDLNKSNALEMMIILVAQVFH